MLPDWFYAGKLPDVIGPFRILRMLGEGSMGAVFLAERVEQFTQRVAIKVLQPSLFPEEAAASMTREERVLSTLDHPGIVRLLDFGETTQGLRYLVMEYVDGEPLDVYCDTRCVPMRRRLEILLEVLETVEYAHRRLVIHADLKPRNILVMEEGRPSLLDFGIATILPERAAPEQAAPELAADPSPVSGFTRNFASPEQLAGERLTVASDIYSLGAIAHSILTGLPPHPIQSDTLHTALAGATSAMSGAELKSTDSVLLQSIAECRKEKSSHFVETMEGNLEAILEKALRIHPLERFESVQQMAEEVRRHLAGYPLRIRPAGWPVHIRKWVLRNQIAAGMTLMLLAIVILSVIGIASQTAEAARKRQLAMTRLYELAHLTDALAGELYNSVHGLEGSESAQAALLQNAHAAMEKLAAEEFQDPQFDIEIAREYEKLARLELNATQQTAEVRRQAADDLNRAVRLLSLLPANEPGFAPARLHLRELTALRDSLEPSLNH